MAISAEFKKKWVKVLRSGKFKQGKGRLYISNGEGAYCCLGVACRVLGKTPEQIVAQDDVWFAQGWLKPLGLSMPTMRSLAIMNDNGRSFKDIADYIEKHLGPRA